MVTLSLRTGSLLDWCKLLNDFTNYQRHWFEIMTRFDSDESRCYQKYIVTICRFFVKVTKCPSDEMLGHGKESQNRVSGQMKCWMD